MKPPSHPAPSGDREVARLFIRALRKAGHEVEVASRLRSYDGTGDHRRQVRIRRAGERLAARYIARHRAAPPALWFTYHLYHKAPDWIGPAVAKALGIPYVVAEASHAPKQENGPWAEGYRAAANALRGAARIICLNPTDAECISRLLGGSERIEHIPPFMDTAPSVRMTPRRAVVRRELASALEIDPATPWIAATAMMRPGDKLASYRLLGEALRRIADRPWILLVAGDGEARRDVEQALDFPGRVRYLGLLGRPGMDRLHAAADIGAWPAINEAFGMALLAAQAAGLPMVAGDRPGVRQIVRHGRTGFLANEGDAEAFAKAVSDLLDDPVRRAEMRITAIETMQTGHNLIQAASKLGRMVADLTKEVA